MGNNTNVEDRSFDANVDNTTRQGNTWVPGESLPEPPPEPPELLGISVTPATADLVVGGTVQLVVAPEPADAELTGPTAASSDSLIATVDAALLVTALAPGEANVTVTDSDFQEACVVTVTAVEE
jgi:uncharacterized protein YjdB